MHTNLYELERLVRERIEQTMDTGSASDGAHNRDWAIAVLAGASCFALVLLAI